MFFIEQKSNLAIYVNKAQVTNSNFILLYISQTLPFSYEDFRFEGCNSFDVILYDIFHKYQFSLHMLDVVVHRSSI